MSFISKFIPFSRGPSLFAKDRLYTVDSLRAYHLAVAPTRVLVVGDSHTGKSHLIQEGEAPIPEIAEDTVISRHNLANSVCRVHAIDTKGDELDPLPEESDEGVLGRDPSLLDSPSWCEEEAGDALPTTLGAVVIVYSVADSRTLARAEHVHIPEVKRRWPLNPIALIGMKLDQAMEGERRRTTAASAEQGQAVAARTGAVIWWEVNGVDERILHDVWSEIILLAIPGDHPPNQPRNKYSRHWQRLAPRECELDHSVKVRVRDCVPSRPLPPPPTVPTPNLVAIGGADSFWKTVAGALKNGVLGGVDDVLTNVTLTCGSRRFGGVAAFMAARSKGWEVLLGNALKSFESSKLDKAIKLPVIVAEELSWAVARASVVAGAKGQRLTIEVAMKDGVDEEAVEEAMVYWHGGAVLTGGTELINAFGGESSTMDSRQRLLEDSVWRDLKVTLAPTAKRPREVEFEVHAAVLRLRCDWGRSITRSGPGGAWMEGTQGSVMMEDVEEELWKVVMDWLYGAPSAGLVSGHEDLAVTDVLSLLDRYGMVEAMDAVWYDMIVVLEMEEAEAWDKGQSMLSSESVDLIALLRVAEMFGEQPGTVTFIKWARAWLANHSQDVFEVLGRPTKASTVERLSKVSGKSKLSALKLWKGSNKDEAGPGGEEAEMVLTGLSAKSEEVLMAHAWPSDWYFKTSVTEWKADLAAQDPSVKALVTAEMIRGVERPPPPLSRLDEARGAPNLTTRLDHLWEAACASDAGMAVVPWCTFYK